MLVLLDAIRQRSVSIEMPPADLAPTHAVVVRLTAAGPIEVRVDGEPIPCGGCDDPAVLGPILTELAARDGFGTLVLAADPEVPFDRVRQVMSVADAFPGVSLSLGAPPGAAP
jgi:hypothetical protein